MPQTTDRIATGLAASRAELLDLGLRNPLLNFRPRRRIGLGLVGVDAGALHEALVVEGRGLAFTACTDEQDDGGEGPDEALIATEPVADPTAAVPAVRLASLPVALSAAQLEERLHQTARLAELTIEETGANTLHLALGFLHWQEAPEAPLRRAPLLLVPVRLERSSLRARYRVVHNGEDVGDNLSLHAKLAQDFAIELPAWNDEDDDGDVDAWLAAVAAALGERPGWSVVRDACELGFFSFARFLMYRDLDLAGWPAGTVEHPQLEALFGGGFHEAPSPVADEGPLDGIRDGEAVCEVLDNDSSQATVLADVAAGRSLVVQGPPGTGKSQTITNLIAEAVFAGKRVLFVAEKLAALEVVKRRLDAVGIGEACLELHSHKATKRAVIAQLAASLELGRPESGDESAPREAARERERLDAYCAAIATPIGASGVTPFAAMGELLRLRREAVQGPDLDPLHHATRDAEAMHLARAALAALVAAQEAVGRPDDHPLAGSRRESLSPAEATALGAGSGVLLGSLATTVAAAGELARILGIDAPSDPADLRRLLAFTDLLLARPAGVLPAVAPGLWQERAGELQACLGRLEELAEIHRRHDVQLIPAAWEQDLLGERQIIAAKGRSWFRWLSGRYRRAVARLRGLCRGGLSGDWSERLGLLDAVLAERRLHELLDSDQALLGAAFSAAWRGRHSDCAALAASGRWLLEVHGRDPRLAATVLPRLAELGADLAPVRAAAAEAATTLAAGWATLLGPLDWQEAEDPGSASWDAQHERLRRLRDEPGLYDSWCAWARAAGACRDAGLADLLAVARGQGDGAGLRTALERAWYGGLLDRAHRERMVLARFARVEHEGGRSRFQQADRASLDWHRARVALAHWRRLPDREAGGQVAVLRRECAKKTRHLAIRRLLVEAEQAVLACRPVLLMSPLSVAAYLAPGRCRFDLVIFDEASQVRPVDAIGALLRAPQAVVVGDSRQLPPTSFFDRQLGDEESGDEDSPTADVESILDCFLARGAPSRMLRWHYRSRHASLIAPSNHLFYGDRLEVMPSPDAEDRGAGLCLRHLPDTVYDRGGSGVNVLEAEAIAEAVLAHARVHAEQSLGVAAFSSRQRDAIADRVDALRRADPALEAQFFARHGTEPFFVKNLENVQGDERDVILISVGYGRDAAGRLSMHFGPLNASGGERRLNVLITRARQRCEVFSNLTHHDIDLERTASEGARCLRLFLRYAAERRLEGSSDSVTPEPQVFEDEVAATLADAGLVVRRELGEGRWRIDLAVVDPARPERARLALLCDGRRYAASRWARDRDRIRDAVLQGLGWRVQRIWSADWYRDPARAVAAVQAALAEPAPRDPPPASSSLRRDPARLAPGPVAVPPYAPFRVDARLGDDDPRRWPVERLADLVVRIVLAEGPIHRERLEARIVAGTAPGRRSSSVQEAVGTAIAAAATRGELAVRGAFLWSPTMAAAPLRDWSDQADKDIAQVAPEECAGACLAALRRCYALDDEELQREAARLLGFRLGGNVREVIGAAITALGADGRIVGRHGHWELTSG